MIHKVFPKPESLGVHGFKWKFKPTSQQTYFSRCRSYSCNTLILRAVFYLNSKGLTQLGTWGPLHVCGWGELPENPILCLQPLLSCPAAEVVSAIYPQDLLEI